MRTHLGLTFCFPTEPASRSSSCGISGPPALAGSDASDFRMQSIHRPIHRTVQLLKDNYRSFVPFTPFRGLWMTALRVHSASTWHLSDSRIGIAVFPYKHKVVQKAVARLKPWARRDDEVRREYTASVAVSGGAGIVLERRTARLPIGS